MPKKHKANPPVEESLAPVLRLRRACRVCGCTDSDCSGCIERTGRRCHWVAWDLCSACHGGAPANDGRSRLLAA